MLIDGSGSMWGEVDGDHKIVILRRNLSELVGHLQTDSEVGLFAFGHREKGNCGDIEEIIPPGPFDAQALTAAIESIQPKGKTPLSAAVRQAAESLRYTEEKATVVILGDGRESCGMDPCATAEELERTGVDLTVHSIAFDLADEVGTQQLQCFAQKTGGLFIQAADSVELVAALEEVQQEVAPAAAPEPAPAPTPRTVVLIAQDAASGTTIPGALTWTFINAETEEITVLDGPSGTAADELAPGTYDVIVESEQGFGEGRFSIDGSGETQVVVDLLASAPAGLVLARESLPAGEVLNVEWTFQGQPDDLLFITATDASENRYPLDDHRRHVVGSGSLASLVAPLEPGAYEVRYFSLAAGGVLHRAAVEVEPAQVELRGPAEADTGTSVEVHWSGPAAPGDIIFLAPVDWGPQSYPSRAGDRVPASTANPVQVPVPDRAGPHEYRYYSWANGKALAAVPIEVVLRAASVTAPSAIPAGSVVSVEFNGPKLGGDTLFFIDADSDANRYYSGGEFQKLVSSGSPARITAPAEPGRYEVRYFSPDGGGLLAKSAVDITAPDVTLDAPRLVKRGETFQLRAIGPAAPGDMVFLSKADSGDNRYPTGANDQFRPTPDGGGFFDDDGLYVFDVTAPAAPGQYEVRYFSWPNGRVLDRRALLVR